LPEGDYDFTVEKFERARFNGSAKMPACNQAKLEITIHSQEYGDQKIFHNLFLHTKTEGLLSNFFAGIGQKKKGERLRMNWNAVIGARGRCQLEHNRYTVKGVERVNNQIKKFYPADEVQPRQAAPQQQTYQQAGQYQQPQYQQQPNYQQQQPMQQTPFPTGQPQQGGGGFTPGQF